MTRRRSVATLLAVLSLSGPAPATVYTGNLNLTWGDVRSNGALPGTGAPVFSPFLCATGLTTGCFSGNFDSAGDKVWASPWSSTSLDLSAGPGSLVYGQAGHNSMGFYNPYSEQLQGPRDYSSVGQPNCQTSVVVYDFACSQVAGGMTRFFPTVVEISGAGATGSGPVVVDTVAGTLSGVLAVAPYLYRFGDASPFNAAAYHIGYYGPGATLTLALTGNFTSTSWTITGGTATFSDPNGVCAVGHIFSPFCTASPGLGGFDPASFSHLSFAGVPVWDGLPEAGGKLLFELPGLVASATLAQNPDGSFSITASTGEFRRGLGSPTNGCPQQLVYLATSMELGCGTLTAGLIGFSGTVTATAVPIPVPAAIWSFGAALGLLGWIRRRTGRLA